MDFVGQNLELRDFIHRETINSKGLQRYAVLHKFLPQTLHSLLFHLKRIEKNDIIQMLSYAIMLLIYEI